MSKPMELKHSRELGGLVPIEGWYLIDGEGEAFGPFETEEDAREYDNERAS